MWAENLLVSAVAESIREERCSREDPFAGSKAAGMKLERDCAVSVGEAFGAKCSLTLQRDCCELEVGH